MVEMDEEETFLNLKTKDMTIKKVTFSDCLKVEQKIKRALDTLKETPSEPMKHFDP